jgi:thiol-disulfide isomerase/thioredoxin
MRLHRHHWSLILLPVVLAGCSTTAGSRFGGTARSRSIAVVGDRPQVATTGEPGGQVSADLPEPEPRRNPRTRIAGRVVDDQGEPVSNVTVRLADGGAKGGMDIRATTDRSGGFTLNGLRPGSTYWLIAEAEDDRGPLSGRVQATTAETGVEIALSAEASGSSNGRSARPSRARPISNREGLEPPPAEEAPPNLNREDLPPTTEDDGTLDPGPVPPTRARRPQLSTPEPAVGWKNRASVRIRSQDEDIVASSTDIESKPRFAVSVETSTSDDEGPNPLPPAIEPGTSSNPDEEAPNRSPSARRAARPREKARATPGPTDSGELAPAPEASLDAVKDRAKPVEKGEAERFLAADFGPRPAPEPGPAPAPPPRPGPVEVASAEPLAATAPPSPSRLPSMPPMGGESVAANEAPPPSASPPDTVASDQDRAPTLPASQPVFASTPPASKAAAKPEAPADYNPFVIAASTHASPDRAIAAVPPSRVPSSTVSPSPTEAPPTAAEPPKKKWGDLAATDPSPVVAEPTRGAATGSFVKRLRGSIENHDPSIAVCSYDARLRKLTDFRLPDLEGKPVRFQDLDADYVLLDFWGTWCPPCLDGIPHLVALQKKYGPSRLRVVGIACEDVPPEQRKAKVEEVSRKLGINYPVLLSTMDGKPCPVQQALQIQAMPTMILVDRRGQVVWRSTGSTPATKDRLDRVLASSLGRSDIVRR